MTFHWRLLRRYLGKGSCGGKQGENRGDSDIREDRKVRELLLIHKSHELLHKYTSKLLKKQKAIANRYTQKKQKNDIDKSKVKDVKRKQIGKVVKRGASTNQFQKIPIK